MMKSPIELREFFFKKLLINWINGKAHETQEREISLGFDFDASSREGYSNEFKFEFRVTGEPEDGYRGIEFEAHLDGFFAFPEELETEQMHSLLALNGSSILYGLLRGQLALISGSFPDGKLTLPTVNMEDVIPDVIKRKQEIASKSSKN